MATFRSSSPPFISRNIRSAHIRLAGSERRGERGERGRGRERGERGEEGWRGSARRQGERGESDVLSATRLTTASLRSMVNTYSYSSTLVKGDGIVM